MIEIKIRVNIKNKRKKDKGFSTELYGGLRPCLELLDFSKDFIKKNLKQDVLFNKKEQKSKEVMGE